MTEQYSFIPENPDSSGEEERTDLAAEPSPASEPLGIAEASAPAPEVKAQPGSQMTLL